MYKKRKAKYVLQLQKKYLQRSRFKAAPEWGPLLMSTLTFDLYRDPTEKTGQKTKALPSTYNHNNIQLYFYWRVKRCYEVISPASWQDQQAREKTTMRQSIGSSYWSLLNFFGPAGLLKMKKQVKSADETKTRMKSRHLPGCSVVIFSYFIWV